MARRSSRTTYKGVSDSELQAFARRLYEKMTEKGWNQSDLARHAFGVDREGKPKGRDRISVYIAGKNLPDDANMKKLADVLGVRVADLAPDLSKAPVDRNVLPIETHGLPDGTMHVRMDAVISRTGCTVLNMVWENIEDERWLQNLKQCAVQIPKEQITLPAAPAKVSAVKKPESRSRARA